MHLVEEFMEPNEVVSLDVPVVLHALRVQVDWVGEALVQYGDDLRPNSGLPTGSQRPRYAYALVWSCICLRVFEILLGTRYRESA